MDYGLMKPYLYVEIENKNVSAYITPYLLSFTYTDNDGLQKQESDDIEIEVEDSKGFFRDNPPARGSALKVKFGYEEEIRDAGIFFIDSYQYKISRSGDTFTIKALAKDVKSSYRTVKTTAFENTTLRKIAEDITKRHGYRLHFEATDVNFQRITQNQKRDLQFLSELCKLYAKTCKISNKTIVIRDIDNPTKIYKLTRDLIIDAEFEVSSLYEANVEVVYLDPNRKEPVKDNKKANVKASGDTKKINHRVESKSQAEAIANNQKMLNEMKEFKAKITSIGIPGLHAGAYVSVEGFGKFDRQYYIKTAKHQITRDGYITELELLLAPGTDKKKKKGKKK